MLKLGAIRRFNTGTSEFIGMVVGYDSSVRTPNEVSSYTVLNNNVKEISVPVDTVSKVVKLPPKVRQSFVRVFEALQKVQRIKGKIEEYENDFYEANIAYRRELVKLNTTQGIMEPNEFLSAVQVHNKNGLLQRLLTRGYSVNIHHEYGFLCLSLTYTLYIDNYKDDSSYDFVYVDPYGTLQLVDDLDTTQYKRMVSKHKQQVENVKSRKTSSGALSSYYFFETGYNNALIFCHSVSIRVPCEQLTADIAKKVATLLGD